MMYHLLLVGMDNPQSSDPRYALFPHPPGCAGHRLMQMIQEVEPNVTRGAYQNIVKTNLFAVGSYVKEIAPEAGLVLRRQIAVAGWHAVLLGNNAADAVMPGLRITNPAMEWKPLGTGKVTWLPHPSGRNTFYNDVRNRKKVGEFLVKEMGK